MGALRLPEIVAGGSRIRRRAGAWRLSPRSTHAGRGTVIPDGQARTERPWSAKRGCPQESQSPAFSRPCLRFRNKDLKISVGGIRAGCGDVNPEGRRARAPLVRQARLSAGFTSNPRALPTPSPPSRHPAIPPSHATPAPAPRRLIPRRADDPQIREAHLVGRIQPQPDVIRRRQVLVVQQPRQIRILERVIPRARHRDHAARVEQR
jgi:hypothetical protein